MEKKARIILNLKNLTYYITPAIFLLHYFITLVLHSDNHNYNLISLLFIILIC